MKDCVFNEMVSRQNKMQSCAMSVYGDGASRKHTFCVGCVGRIWSIECIAATGQRYGVMMMGLAGKLCWMDKKNVLYGIHEDIMSFGSWNRYNALHAG